MKDSELEKIFKDRIIIHTGEVNTYKSRFSTISWLRVIIGISIIGCIIVAFKWSADWPIIGLIFLQVIVFVFLIFQSKNVERKIKFHASMSAVNLNELDCLENNFSKNFNGADFADTSHPYTSDLDVFGKSSLYQFLCRAGSTGGRERLASWLREKASFHIISKRQEAVKSLSQDLDWRQHLQTLTSQLSTVKKITLNLPTENINALNDWLLEKPFLISVPFFLVLINMLQLIALALVVMVIISFPIKYLFIPVIVNAIILRKFNKKIFTLRTKTSQHTRFLKTYGAIFKLIEQKNFSNSYTLELQSRILDGAFVASQEITKLSDLLYYLDSTQNPYFYPIGNLLFSSDIYWVCQLEKWKLKNKENVGKWFNTIYEFEALSSIAAVYFIKPTWSFPEVYDTYFHINTEELVHPLIPSLKAVSNDIGIEGAGKCVVLTGSNMSGKSTFLRTLGINAVLAYAGAPVAARKFSIGPANIFTSMRTQDSLEENTSSFYAELKRLRSLLETTNNTTTVFYLLDEILKGTNSRDRHNGAKALISQLNNSNATGLISTHDLELGELEKRNPGKIFNYSFNSYLENGKLRFDYKLHAGICNSFNASALMTQIGIKFDPNVMEQ